MTMTVLDKPGIIQREENGLIVLSPATGRPHRRVLYVNNYGGKTLWKQLSEGLFPGSHLYGCIELVQLGYEVALAEPVPDFYWSRRSLPHDLRYFNLVRSWLGKDGLVYCGHNVLYWLPFLKALGAVKCKIVSLVFAREPLNFARSHSGIIAITPAAVEQCRKLAPKVPVAHIGWGVDLDYYPSLPYNPQTFFSCGIANRDFETLSRGAALTRQPVKVLVPGLRQQIEWPANVNVVDSGSGWNIDKTKKIQSVRTLANEHYATCTASLIIMKDDPTEYTANGFTNLLEAMALARPVIMTRTGAMPSEIDVEKIGFGLFVPSNDPKALGEAFDYLAKEPGRAEAMGLAGRKFCEENYTIQRYAQRLHAFFEAL